MKSNILFLFGLATLICSCGQSNNSGFFGSNKECSLNPPIKTFLSDRGFTTIALNEDGEVFQWTFLQNDPNVKIINMKLKNTCMIDSYNAYGMSSRGVALLKNGNIMEWDVSKPENLTETKPEKPVRKISGGFAHLLILNEDGTVTGIGDQSSYLGFQSLENVIDIAAGSEYSIACTKEGKVYVTGMNSGHNLALGYDASRIEGAYQIEGLENIVKVGTTDNDNHFGIDNQGNLTYWDLSTYLAKVDFRTLPEKAIKIGSGAAFYLSSELKWKWRPDRENNKRAAKYLDLESDEKLKDIVDYKLIETYCVALRRDGTVGVYTVRNYPAGKDRGDEPAKVDVIPDLKVSLDYYQR